MAKGDTNKRRGGYQPFPHQRAMGITGYVKKIGYGKKGSTMASSTMATPQASKRPSKAPRRRRASSEPPREGPGLVAARTRGAPCTHGRAMHRDNEVAGNTACTSLTSGHVPHTYMGEGSTIARRLMLAIM